MLCGAHPFDVTGNASNAAILLAAIDPKLDNSKMWPKLSESARDLLTRLLDPDPESRTLKCVQGNQSRREGWGGIEGGDVFMLRVCVGR